MKSNEEKLCELTKKIWHYYLLDPTEEHFKEMFSLFSEKFIFIGTGKHEFFTTMDKAIESIDRSEEEVNQIRFQLIDEWYEALCVSEDVYLVYGKIWARQVEKDNDEILNDMDTRFSVLFQKQENAWKLVHVHHSLPYVDQHQGEYYPKSLFEKAKEAIDLAKVFKQKSELDLMTGLFNNISFKSQMTEILPTHCGNLYIFDLDHFKLINDTYGHLKGDEILTLFSTYLKRYFSKDAILGRMGGDEFAVFEYANMDEESSIHNILQLQREFAIEAKEYLSIDFVSFSVGIASAYKMNEPYIPLYKKADFNLYEAKHQGRQTYHWNHE